MAGLRPPPCLLALPRRGTAGGGAALLGKKLEEDALKVDFLGAGGGCQPP